MSARRFFFVVNPAAGRGHLGKKWQSRIRPLLQKKLGDFEFAFTLKPGDATILTRQALWDGHQRIVSLGGDGTLNEVVNGFFNNGKSINPEARLGILPFGSGGDFIRSLFFSRDWAQNVDKLAGDGVRRIDVGWAQKMGTAEGRYFINIAEVGLGGRVMLKVNGLNRWWPALTRYLWGVVCAVAAHQNVWAEVDFGDGVSQRLNLTNVIVANGRYFGRGMCPTPQANLTDGFFDVVLVKNITRRNFWWHFPKLYKGTKMAPTAVTEFRRTRQVHIRPLSQAGNLILELDGENWGFGEISFQVCPQALTVVV
jgi:YegS/Rv2252/BmrU family lipid kinase